MDEAWFYLIHTGQKIRMVHGGEAGLDQVETQESGF